MIGKFRKHRFHMPNLIQYRVVEDGEAGPWRMWFWNDSVEKGRRQAVESLPQKTEQVNRGLHRKRRRVEIRINEKPIRVSSAEYEAAVVEWEARKRGGKALVAHLKAAAEDD